MVHDDWQLQESDLYVVTRTEHSGRAVFARPALADLPGTLILTTSLALSPISHVILRPFRREVCAYCFAYDRGRAWKIRINAAGVVFCSETCQTEWTQYAGDIGLEAHVAVETFVQQRRRHEGNGFEDQDGDVDMGGLIHETESLNRRDIDEAWKEAESNGNLIARARSEQKPSRFARRMLRSAVESTVDTDLLSYLLSGILKMYSVAKDYDQNPISAACLLPSLVALVEDSSIFTTQSGLAQHVRAYHTLVAILPEDLLPFVQPTLCRELASRASHNAFSIRPAGSSDGEQSNECFGWGVWPEASLFNHSCAPNVRKERRGRQWYFFNDPSTPHAETMPGNELCITYLGGDEREMNVLERRKKLRDEWGFNCCCWRCVAESSANN